MSTFTIICWSFTAIIYTYNIWSFGRPFPRSKAERESVRNQVFDIIKTTRNDGDLHMETSYVQNEKRYENLLVYKKFLSECSSITLNSLISDIRNGRRKFRTTLLPTRLTAEHVKVYLRFHDVKRELSVMHFARDDEQLDKLSKQNQKLVDRTTLYTLSHLDQSENILSVVEGRGIYDLKQVKALIKDIEETPAGALNDGML